MTACNFYVEILGLKNEGLIQRLCEVTSYRKFNKKTLLVSKGQAVDEVSFLVSGIIRGYFFDSKGREATDCFGFECGSPALPCAELGAISPINIEALTECCMFSVPLNDIFELSHEYSEISMMSNDISQRALYKQWETKIMLYHPAIDRYKWFLEKYPGIINYVSLKHIASFLNITPVSLSRLRRQVREENQVEVNVESN